MNKNFGFLNDIFNSDNEPQKKLYRRIEYAFGKKGEYAQDFWKRFFSCEDYHRGFNFIYIFSQEQLNVLFDWWKMKVDDINDDDNNVIDEHKKIKADLLLSKNYFFSISEEDGMTREKVLICCFSKKLLNKVYSVKKIIPDDLFAGKFDKSYQDGPGSLKEIEKYIKYLNELMGSLREKIINIYRKYKIHIEKEKWLFYNGQNRDVKNITNCSKFCSERKINCPFI